MALHVYADLEQGSDAWMDLRCGMLTASVVGKLLTVNPPGALDYDCPTCKASAGSPCVSLTRKTPTTIKTYHEGRTVAALENEANLPPTISVADNDTSRALTATLAAERVAGFTEDGYMSSDMWRGVESEPYARDLYSGHYEAVTECGFMVRTEPMPWDPNEVARPVDEEQPTWSLGYSPDGLVGDDGLIEIKAPRSKTQLLTVVADEVPAHNMAQCQAGLLVSGRKWLDFVSFVGGMHIYVKRVLPDPMWFAAIEAACRTFETNAAALVDDYHKRVDGKPVAERIPTLEVI